MAREAKGWEALCFAAASEKDPERLQEIIVELNVLLRYTAGRTREKA
jgi:hypothetical protein